LALCLLYVRADEVAQSGHVEEDIGQSPHPRGPDFLRQLQILAESGERRDSVVVALACNSIHA